MRSLAEIDRRLNEIDTHIRNAGLFGLALPAGEAKERATLIAERPAAARVERRHAAASVLMSGEIALWRARFIHQLAEHAVDLAARHGLTVAAEFLEPHARLARRAVHCEPIFCEEAYAVFLHEAAHVVLPEADGRQHRHEYVSSQPDGRQAGALTIVAPRAECAAWRWAFRSALVWTAAMQREAEISLESYRQGASEAERRAMDETLKVGRALVRPAPDTQEGREDRVAFISREDRIREILEEDRRRLGGHRGHIAS